MQLNFSTAPSANQPTVFTFDKMDVRVIRKDGEPWFVASDVLNTLTLDRKALERLDADEKGVSSIHTLGGAQEQTIINESGLYSLTLTSRKPAAKRFKKWVTSEVLPSIRKTGTYTVGQPQPAFQIPATLSAALRLAAEQAEQIERQQEQLAIAAPKVEFVDRYVESSGLKGFREVAKLLKANEARLREFLTDSKVMYRLGGDWMAYQNHIDAGRFEVKAGTSTHSGHAFSRCMFTAKGVSWLAGEWAKFQLGGVAA